MQILAAPELSPAARQVLGRVGPVTEKAAVATPEALLPAGYFSLRTLEIEDGIATIEGTAGPVWAPRSGLPPSGCGVNHRVRMKSGPDGWKILESTVTVC